MLNVRLFDQPEEYYEATSGETVNPWVSFTRNWDEFTLYQFKLGDGTVCTKTDRFMDYATQYVYSDETGEFQFYVGRGFNDTMIFAYRVYKQGEYYYSRGEIYDVFDPIYMANGKVHYNAEIDPEPAPVIYETPANNDEVYYTTVDGNPLSFASRNTFLSNTGDTSDPLTVVSNTYDSQKGCFVLKLSGTAKSVAKYAFQNEQNLASICFPDSIEVIWDRAFDKARQMRAVKFPASLKKLHSKSFNECNNLEAIDLPNSLYYMADGVFRRCFKITSVVLPPNVSDLWNSAKYSGCFEECTRLSTVVLNDSLYAIGAYTFATCLALRNVFIPAGVQYIDPLAFDSSPYLEIMVVDSDNTYFSSKDINGNECNCIYTKRETWYSESSASWTVPAGVLIVANPSTMPSFFNLPITELGDAFNCRSDLKEITLPDGITTICGNTFHLTSISTITIPSSVTLISDWTLFHCVYLEEIIVADGNARYSSKDPVTGEQCNCIWDTQTNHLISGCMNTKIPHGITYIDAGAFNNHQQMTTLNIPNEGFTVDSDNVFNGCIALRHVYYDGTMAEYGEKVILHNPWMGDSTWYPWNEALVPCNVVHCTDGDIEMAG